jgi:hypothetical protein
MLLHAFITHRFMFRRIRFDLRAIQCDLAEFPHSLQNHAAPGTVSPVRACAQPAKSAGVDVARQGACRRCSASATWIVLGERQRGLRQPPKGPLNGGCGPESSGNSGNARAVRVVRSSVGDLLILVLFRRQDYACECRVRAQWGARVAPLSVLRFIPMGVSTTPQFATLAGRSTLRAKN